MSEYLSQEELCKKLNVSITTLYRYRKEGMPYIKLKGIRYSYEEVMEWLKNRK